MNMPKNDTSIPEKALQLEPVTTLKNIRSVGLPIALGISVVISIFMIVVSMAMYLNSNLSRIDLSKPKYAVARHGVSHIPKEPQEDFSSSGSVDQKAIEKAIKILESRRAELRKSGDFTTPTLSDNDLGIGK